MSLNADASLHKGAKIPAKEDLVVMTAKAATKLKRQIKRQVHEQISNELGKSGWLEAREAASHAYVHGHDWNQKQSWAADMGNVAGIWNSRKMMPVI